MSFYNILNNVVKLLLPKRERTIRPGQGLQETENPLPLLGNVNSTLGECQAPQVYLYKMERFIALTGYAPQALVSGIGLVPGRNILCKLANNSPLAHHTRDKLGCCIISYRNIITSFPRREDRNFLSNLKLFLNRGTPTPLTNLHLTNLYRLFILILLP